MNPIAATAGTTATPFLPDTVKRRVIATGGDADTLADIYDEQTNMAVWRRTLSAELAGCVQSVLSAKHDLEIARRVTPGNTAETIEEALRLSGTIAFSQDVAALVDMFCCLFDLTHAGLRLRVLNRAMCPRFHVDNVPCRLVTTYHGTATQWLAHEDIDRTRLGRGNQGKPDSESGLYNRADAVRQLGHGDVALLKGELWIGNENAGLVHRSPAVAEGESRLLLTLDIG